MFKDRLSNAVSRLWNGRCDVVEYTEVTDGNGITKHEKVVIAKGIPCRVSYESDTHGIQSRTTDNISQKIKLFVLGGIEVRPGSEITVTQNGVTRNYVSSGIPAVYTAHQEIPLVDGEEYA